MTAATVTAEGTDPLVVRVAGDWKLGADLPPQRDVVGRIRGLPAGASMELADGGVGAWDTVLVAYLSALVDAGREASVSVGYSRLPDGVSSLLDLAFAVSEREGARRSESRDPWLSRIGKQALAIGQGVRGGLEFLGDAILSVGRLLTGRARWQPADFWAAMEDAGPRALGIVGLISFLVGAILAFVGAVQLEQFGAGIYVANLVGLAMTREMAAMMTAVIMAGRTAAAYAAELGTMRVNEEIDALSTMDIDPMDYLVLPRLLALVIMMPLLTLYADLLGILGGLVVGVTMLDLGVLAYYLQTLESVGLDDFLVGLGKSVVFGVLVALIGCLRGIQAGNSARAVGEAATRAVVTCIVAIVVADATITVVLTVAGI
jgi:phospholipid/cholesterol/gamma-HCH transport system permease protein